MFVFWIHVYGKTGFEMTPVWPDAVHRFLTFCHWQSFDCRFAILNNMKMYCQSEADGIGLGSISKLRFP